MATKTLITSDSIKGGEVKTADIACSAVTTFVMFNFFFCCLSALDKLPKLPSTTTSSKDVTAIESFYCSFSCACSMIPPSKNLSSNLLIFIIVIVFTNNSFMF